MAKERREVVDRRSILDPHLDAVIDLRRRGHSWQRIADELKAGGVTVTTQNLWKWFRRRQRRATKVARELRPFDQLSKPEGQPHRNIGSVENPANTADQAASAVERLTSKRPPDEFRPQPVKRQSTARPSSSSESETFSVGDDILK